MRLLLVSVVSLYFQVRLFLNRNEKNEKLLIGFTCVVDFSVSSAKRYLCVIHSGSQKRTGTRKSSASPQASVTCSVRVEKSYESVDDTRSKWTPQILINCRI